METESYSLPDLPTQEELLRSLICEDLKSHCFFTGLRNLGLDDAYHQTDLSILILTCARLNPHIDTISDFYFNLLDKHSKKLHPRRSALEKAATRLYEELMAFKAQQEAQAKQQG